MAHPTALSCYLAYRRDGGENHNSDGRIALAVTESLLAGNPPVAMSLLEEHLHHPQLPDQLRPFILALQAIAAGNRGPSLADAPGLDYTSAAEILLLDALAAR